MDGGNDDGIGNELTDDDLNQLEDAEHEASMKLDEAESGVSGQRERCG